MRKKKQRAERRVAVVTALKECELRTLAELYRRTRDLARKTMIGVSAEQDRRYYESIMLWGDDQFRKCLSDGHIVYGICIKLFSQVFAETGLSDRSAEQWFQIIMQPAGHSGATALPDSIDTLATESSNKFRSIESSKWRPYRNALRDLLDGAVPGSNISLHRLYVPLRATYDDTLERSPHLVTFLSRKQQSDSDKRSNFVRVVDDVKTVVEAWLGGGKYSNDTIRLIRGGPGSGKSTFTKLIASEIVKGSGETLLGIRQTVLISLQRVPENLTTVNGILSWFINDKTNFPGGAPNLDCFDEDGRLLVIFDGLDELCGGGTNALKKSKKFMDSLCNWLASRNSAKFTTFGLVLGRDVAIQKAEANLGLAPHQTLQLAPFIVTERGLIGDEALRRKDQRHDWWNAWAKESGLPNEHLPQAINSPGLLELSAEPLLLYIIAITKVYEETSISMFSRYAVYDYVLNRIVSNWHNRAGNGPIHFPSDPILLQIIELIACAAWSDGGRVTSLEKVLALGGQNKELVNNVRTFLYEQDIFRALLAFYMKLDSGNLSADVGIEFSHKSFCEFFIARRLLRQISHIIDTKEAFVGDETILSTFPDGFRGINQVISGFLQDGIREWPEAKREKTAKLALNTLRLVYGDAGGNTVNEPSNNNGRSDLAVEVAVIALDIICFPGGKQTLLNWRTGNMARRFLETIMAVQSKSDWYWRHAYTSLIPDEFGPCASHLRRIDFSGQNLAGMRFTGLNFFGCSFDGCDLRDSAFIDCIVCGASFDGANLEASRWNGTNISSASFHRTVVDLADFRLSNGKTNGQFLTSIGWERAFFDYVPVRAIVRPIENAFFQSRLTLPILS